MSNHFKIFKIFILLQYIDPYFAENKGRCTVIAFWDFYFTKKTSFKRLSLFRVSDKSKLDMVTVERDEENKVEDDGQLSGERYEQLTLQLARTQYR